MVCIVKAIAYLDEKEYHGIGDAGPRSVNNMIQPHSIRMAETRAKARALRDLTNVGMTAIEEMGEDERETYQQPINNQSMLSDKQIKRLYAIAHSVEVDAETVNDQIRRKYGKGVENLIKEEYDTICKGYESLKK